MCSQWFKKASVHFYSAYKICFELKLHRLWQNKYLRKSTYTILQSYIWKLIAWCIQWYLFHIVNVYIFILYKISHNKENEGHLSLSLSPSHTPSLYAPFTYAHKLSLDPLKLRPHPHSCVTVIVFQAKAQYGLWTLECAHYGQHIHFLVIIWSLAHRIAPYFDGDNDGHCIWNEITIRSAYTFCGDYTITGSPYNYVFCWWHDQLTSQTVHVAQLVLHQKRTLSP